MSTGWIKLGDIWYYLESSGAIKTGWWNNYYFGSDGAMRTGWQLIDNKWYYFYKANDPNITEYKEGLMATNIEIDGWTIGSSGVAVESLEQKIDEIKRICNNTVSLRWCDNKRMGLQRLYTVGIKVSGSIYSKIIL